MSRRSRNSRAWRYVWSGIRRDADARALVLASETEDWRCERFQYSDSDSEADYPAVVVPPVPSAVPVTGESYCSCDSLSESNYNPRLRGFHRVKDCHCGEDDQDFDWVWDDSSRSTATLLSCDNRKVNFHSDYSCGTAAIRGAKQLAEGQHFWEIKMTSPVYGTDMMVGIGTSDVNLDKYRHSFCSLLGKDEESWGLSYTGLLHHKGDKVNFSSRFGQGSIIGVHLDTWHGTLTFFKNRKCIGVAATELQNKRLYPMACSTAAKSSMKVIRSCFAPTSLQYLCCARLRQLLPGCSDTLSVLPLPPGLRHLLHNKLGWVLSLNSCSDEGADSPERPSASCPTASCPSASCPTVSCPSASCPTASCPSASCPTASCPTASCPTASCPSASCPTVSCPTASYPSASCPTANCPTASYPSASCPTSSCPTASYPTASCPSASCPCAPAACRSLCDSDSEDCCSDPEAYQRKRCRWT